MLEHLLATPRTGGAIYQHREDFAVSVWARLIPQPFQVPTNTNFLSAKKERRLGKILQIGMARCRSSGQLHFPTKMFFTPGEEEAFDPERHCKQALIAVSHDCGDFLRGSTVV